MIFGKKEIDLNKVKKPSEFSSEWLKIIKNGKIVKIKKIKGGIKLEIENTIGNTTYYINMELLDCNIG